MREGRQGLRLSVRTVLVLLLATAAVLRSSMNCKERTKGRKAGGKEERNESGMKKKIRDREREMGKRSKRVQSIKLSRR